MANTSTAQSGHFHAVRFYDSPESLARIVAGFMAEGLTAHHPALAIATPEHRIAIEAALRAKGWDVDTLTAAGDLTLLDAEATLSSFMVDGMPDPNRFDAVASGYAMGNFYKDAQRSDVCQLHTHQIADDEQARPAAAIN